MAIAVQGLSPLLYVFDIARSVHFYCDLLGFEVTAQGSYHGPGLLHWAELQMNGKEVLLKSAYADGERPAQPDPCRMAAHADTVLMFCCPEVDAAYGHLVEAGMKVEPPTVARYGLKELFVRDPDGYEICFQWPEKCDDSE